MQRVFLALVALAATFQTAAATCKKEGLFPGAIGPKQTVSRTLTLMPPKALIAVITDSGKDSLGMMVFRPNGQIACKRRPPASVNDCTPTIKKAGVHTVRIFNPHKRAITYVLNCGSGIDD